MTDAYYMRIAIQTAREAIKDGEMPFGACLIDQNGSVLFSRPQSCQDTCKRNRACRSSSHPRGRAKAPVARIERLCLYATCEPCSMCFSACLWSKLSRVVYAARVVDGERFGIASIPLSCGRIQQLSHSDVKISGDVLRDESVTLFAAWQAANGIL